MQAAEAVVRVTKYQKIKDTIVMRKRKRRIRRKRRPSLVRTSDAPVLPGIVFI